MPRSLSERIHALGALVARLERDGQVSPADVSGVCTEADTLAVLVALGLVGNSPGSSEGSPRAQAPRQGPSRAATSTDPSPALAGLDGAALRRLRYRFAHRLGRFSAIPADVTWEAATAPGSPWRGTVEGDGRRPSARPDTVPVPTTGTLPGRIGTGNGTHRDASGRIGTGDGIGTHRDACGTPPSPVFPGLCDGSGRIGTHRDASPSSPLTLPSSPEIPEKEEDARGTGENGTPIGTHRDAQDRDASGRIGTPSSPTVPTRENPLEVLARASRGRVSIYASTHDQTELALQLGALGLVGEELERFGAALAGDGLKTLWPKSKAVAALKPHGAVTAGFFLCRAGDARMLADGVQRWREAQAEAAARKATPARPAAAPSRPLPPPVDPAAAGARARALLGRSAPPIAPAQVSP